MASAQTNFEEGGLKYSYGGNVENNVSVVGYSFYEPFVSINNHAVVYYNGTSYIVTCIAINAFRCYSFSYISIPDSVTIIGNSTFDGCPFLTQVVFSDSSKLGTIGDGAFSNSGLSSINMSASVASIGEGAFARTRLTSVTIGAAVTSIGSLCVC
ncbi:leucine-rich repeat domain-containing protein [Flavobacterium sp.]|uniref:leucine-rich repeat domain-containing protein n=1 Tax=Flavobacterium sp. TaxID=239 RepID=UPI002615AFFD|nr:leucine-rich repeat domain-containing protein [Flavobacterium sp.]MDG2433330.1 leucine-rich repeat domain-containing protein [Flavobacterium sp.]